MKLAVAIAGASALPSAFVVWRGFEQSIQKAAEMGFHGVELALKSEKEIDRDQLHKWLNGHGLEVSCISTGQVFADLGLYFTHPEREARKKAVEVFSGLIDIAKDFGKMVNVGRARGFIAKDQTKEEAEGLFIDMMREICDIAGPKGVAIIIEPVNRYEINFINNLDEATLILNRVNRKNLGVMPDVFHMNIEDDKIGDSLVRNRAMIKYIHFADSNRLAPGQGHIDFSEVFESLRKADFDGWASVEILPKPDPDTAARQAAEYLLPLIRQYNIKKSI